MNANFTLKGYGQTFIARSLLSLVLVGVSLTGLAIIKFNLVNVYYYQMDAND